MPALRTVSCREQLIERPGTARACPESRYPMPFGASSKLSLGCNDGHTFTAGRSGSRPISRVLSRTIIHLGPPSPATSSDLPESTAGHGIAFLFGLAPGGVYLAAACCHLRGALLPHHFTLTPRSRRAAGRFIFCCTFRRLSPPRRYLAPCPVEPGLSSPSFDGAIAWPTPVTIVS